MTRTRPITLALAALSLSVALAGCGETDATAGAGPTASSAGVSDEAAGESGDETGDETTEDGSTVTKDEPIGDTPIQTGPAGEASLPLGAVPDAIVQRDDVQAAIDAEAKRAGVRREAVTVAGYADVTWSDGSIGCPREGMMYTQALVPGHQLVLEVDGEHASYHAAQGKDFSFCAQPVGPATSESSGGPVTDR
ncbi:hypothetical protein BJF86_02665 [Serinicoccus sp. CNJ-927]|uniref:hypothetical protein n=1 Tax=Serinicoccus sp. CNJ-927 TaxID=1904970 RepID=UPI0009653DD4|nr:hypothetical protein [Serinicoccus sp. CNJ-927]OLT41921.1 hypothetical protein BJF86_02665 [Serinicoccus sp. CNJ-927]